jgi:hypothetical protein
MILAGHFTDVYGPRWVWGLAAVLAAAAGAIGYVLARGAASEESQPVEEPAVAVPTA